MRREEIPAVLNLRGERNVPEGTHALDTWFDYDPDGFYVAVADDGTVLGSCAGVIQNDYLAFIGLYAVKSDYQKSGIGRRIWNAVMERICDCNVGVNPVTAQVQNYRDHDGLPPHTDWCSACIAPHVDESLFRPAVPETDILFLTTLDEDMINDVIQYDSDVYGVSRGLFVPLVCGQGEAVAMVAITTTDKKVCGYGSIMKNIKGKALVGPLYADNEDIAETILHKLIKAFPSAKSDGVVMFTTDGNPPAIALTKRLGFRHLDRIARLYRKEEFPVKYDNIFGQHNLHFSIC